MWTSLRRLNPISLNVSLCEALRVVMASLQSEEQQRPVFPRHEMSAARHKCFGRSWYCVLTMAREHATRMRVQDGVRPVTPVVASAWVISANMTVETVLMRTVPLHGHCDVRQRSAQSALLGM